MTTNDVPPIAARRWRRRRTAAAACAMVLAAALAVAGCSSSSSGKRSAGAAAAPAGQNTGSAGGSDAVPGRTGDSVPGEPAGPVGTPGAGGTGGADKTATAPAAPAAPTYLARTATLTVRTPHVEQQLDAARAMAADAGGYAGDEDTTVDARNHARSTIQLRVPAAAYDGLLTRLARLGTLLSRNVSVEDVTGQVVDVQSRIASQKASLARVRALMDRASSLTDVVSLESELTTRESALESLEAQRDSLSSRTDLATITLNLTEPPVKPAPPRVAEKKHDGFWTTVGHGLRDGWHAFSVALRAVLVVAAVLLPFALLALLVWSGHRLVRRLLPGDPARGRAAFPSSPPSPPSPSASSASSQRPPDGRGPRVPGQALPAYPGAAEKPADGGREEPQEPPAD